MLQSSRILSSAVAALAVVISIPSLAGAEMWKASPGGKPHPEVAEQLRDFKEKAGELRIEADYLNTYARGRQMSWQSHAHRQTAAKTQINQLGKMLTELENQKHLASDTQRMAIEQVRPHLAAAAQNLTQAMEMVDEQRNHVRHPDYAQAVRDLYDNSRTMHEKLDTILDYENSKVRFESMELQPGSAEAKS